VFTFAQIVARPRWSEMPSDATILRMAVKDTCFQVEVTSSAIAKVLGSNAPHRQAVIEPANQLPDWSLAASPTPSSFPRSGAFKQPRAVRWVSWDVTVRLAMPMRRVVRHRVPTWAGLAWSR